MALLNSVLRLPRWILRVLELLVGRRIYVWAAVPPAKLFVGYAYRSRGWTGMPYRAVYFLVGSVLKFRERLRVDHLNFSARLRAPVSTQVLGNIALWQQAVYDAHPSRQQAHANLRILASPDEAQIDSLMSLLLMSDVFCNVNVFFDELAARNARISSLSVAEEGNAARDEFDLNAPHPLRANTFRSSVWRHIFSGHAAFERNVNSYLKVAHPGAFVIALALRQGRDGLSDQWIDPWEKPIERLAREFPKVAFVVLNAVGPRTFQRGLITPGGPLSFARFAGLTFAETICLAQKADAFIGQLDVFGIAARAAQCPGLYMGSLDEDLSDSANSIWHSEVLAPDSALAKFRDLMANKLSEAEDQTYPARSSAT